jgi:hypothetical protein
MNRLLYFWNFKCWPALVDLRVKWSTWKSRTICSPSSPLTILINNEVFSNAVTHDSAWISTGEHQLGNSVISTGYSARVPVHDPMNDTPDYRDLKYLAGIAHLAKTGSLKLRTSAHLLAERDYQPSGRFRGYGYEDLNLLGRLELEPIDAWLPSELGGGQSSWPCSNRAALREHIESIGDDRYRQLRDCLGQSNSQDAWHIRTAEKYGAFCFLTMDRPLLRAIESQKGHAAIKSLATKVWTPSQLGNYLRLSKISPVLMSYHDGDARVHRDIHMPNQERAKYPRR